MKIKTKNILKIVSAFATLGVGALLFASLQPNIEHQDTSVSEKPQATQTESGTIKEIPKTTPTSALLTIPYTVQAPNKSWDIHEESCEEAVVLMSKLYLNGQTKDIVAATASKEMLKMKSWQKAHYGTEPDLTIAKIGAFGKSYYGLRYKYLPNFTTTNIKELITAGHPVIVPVMTHSLQNPNYGRQTTYHVLLIKGYNAKGVVTNDPGISKGKDYFYTWDILYKAIDAQKSKLKQGRALVYFY